VQTEKLASLGRMSAGIIHEINNPLNFATTGLYTLRKKGKLLGEEQQAEFTEVLQDVEEGIKRVKDIVSDLITFTHPDNEQVENVDVANVIASAMRFLSNEIKDKVRVEVNLRRIRAFRQQQPVDSSVCEFIAEFSRWSKGEVF
jgi:two-component system sensor histidine kinase PhcS